MSKLRNTLAALAVALLLAWLLVAAGHAVFGARQEQAGAVTTETVHVTLHEGTNLAIALAPDGRMLALDLQGGIWTLPIEGGAAKRLTTEYADARQPAWSPDGEQIVFQSYRDGGWHIWTIRRDGSGLRQLTAGPFDHREPHWASDGRRLAFSSDRTGSYNIWELDLESGALRQLTFDSGNSHSPAWSPDGRAIAFVSDRRGAPGIWLRTGEGSERLLAGMSGRLASPSWSPDGRRLVFQRFEGSEAALYEIDMALPSVTGNAAVQTPAPRRITVADEDAFPFRAAWISATELLYTADGRIKRRTMNGAATTEIAFTADLTLARAHYTRRLRDLDSVAPQRALGLLSPAVSPAGDRIVLSALNDLWLLTIGRATPERLTRDPYLDLDPAWSPDGSRVAFVSDRAGSMDIWIRDLASGEDRRLTTLPGDEEGPAWSPDGNRIAFVEDERVRAVNVTTGEVQTLNSDVSAASQPSWSGDGRTVAVSALRPYSSRFREGVFEVVYIPAQGGALRTFTPVPHVSVAIRGSKSPLWSPDGLKLALVMNGVLWIQPVRANGEPEGPPHRVTNELAASPSWAGDSRSLVYLSNDRLRRVRLDDGRAEDIAVDLVWRRELPVGRAVVHAGALFDGTSPELRRNVDIILDEHRIVSVEPHRPEQHTGRLVDASGLTVMPGLVEMHTHGDTSVAQGRAWLAYGITTVREVSSEPYGARERVESFESGARLGPRTFFTGSSMDGPRLFRPSIALDGGPQLEMEMVRAQRLGYDLIKTYVRLPDAQMARIVELAHQQGLPVTSHELFPAVGFATDGVEHYTFTSRRGYSTKASLLMRGYQDIRELVVRSGIQYTPTLTVQGGWPIMVARDASFVTDPRFKAFYPVATVERLSKQAGTADPNTELPPAMRNIQRAVLAIFKEGSKVTAGTDTAPYAVTLHAELELLVLGGFTPFEALRAATVHAAEALAVSRDLGTIEPGKLADMVAVSGNPLEDIRSARNTRIVIRNGIAHDLESLLRRP